MTWKKTIDKKKWVEQYVRGCELIRPYLLLKGKENLLPDEENLHEGIKCLEEVANFYEIENIECVWAVYWLIGKAYQVLGMHQHSYEYHLKAVDKVDNDETLAQELTTDVKVSCIREVAGSALHIGEFQIGIEYCEKALVITPDDPELQSNLAVALLLSGDFEKAYQLAESCTDSHAKFILEIMDRIKGEELPKSLGELDELYRERK